MAAHGGTAGRSGDGQHRTPTALSAEKRTVSLTYETTVHTLLSVYLDGRTSEISLMWFGFLPCLSRDQQGSRRLLRGNLHCSTPNGLFIEYPRLYSGVVPYLCFLLGAGQEPPRGPLRSPTLYSTLKIEDGRGFFDLRTRRTKMEKGSSISIFGPEDRNEPFFCEKPPFFEEPAFFEESRPPSSRTKNTPSPSSKNPLFFEETPFLRRIYPSSKNLPSSKNPPSSKNTPRFFEEPPFFEELFAGSYRCAQR